MEYEWQDSAGLPTTCDGGWETQNLYLTKRGKYSIGGVCVINGHFWKNSWFLNLSDFNMLRDSKFKIHLLHKSIGFYLELALFKLLSPTCLP